MICIYMIVNDTVHVTVTLYLDQKLYVLQYKEYEEVVVEHRAMKERQRLKAEQEERERKAAIKVVTSSLHRLT